jgi:adenosylcobinamide-GDP ribazoletransferase
MKPDTLPPVVTDLAVAFVLLSRLPVPHLPETAFARGAEAVWAYPVVGAVLGGIATLVGMALLLAGAPGPVAAGVLLAVLTAMSGAMHEDGLADTADGFWGGHSFERRLEIMADSRIGTFGTLALIFATGLRWAAIAVLLPAAPGAVVAAAALSRAAMPVVMHVLPQSRAGGLSHSVGRPKRPTVLAGLVVAVALGAASAGLPALAAVPAVLVVLAGMILLARRKIGGQTGDVLGAVQQVSEIAILGSLAALVAA